MTTPGTTDNPIGSTVTTGRGDEVLVRRALGLIDEARSSKKSLEGDWRKWREYYEGDQWANKGKRATWRVSNVINVCFANVETGTAVVMSMMPKLMAKPANGKSSVETADRVTSALSFLWKKLKLRKTIVLVVKDGFCYGSGLFKTIWDPGSGSETEDDVYDLETGEVIKDDNGKPRRKKSKMGEVSVTRVSPFHFHPDPLALSIEDAAYVVQVKEKDLGYIRRRWPKKAARVIADVTGSPVLDRANWSSAAGVTDTQHDPATVKGMKDTKVTPMRSQVALYELWVRDVGLLHDPDEDVDWEAEYEKYPNGRVIMMAGNTVLQDTPNPFEDGRFPFTKYDNVERPDRFWGKSEIEVILTLQDEINRRSSQIMESANLTANPKIAIPLGCGLDKDTVFTTKPGEKWPYRGPKPPEFVPPPPMPTYVLQSLDMSMGFLERVSGNYDMLSGSRPQGVTAASALQGLKEMAEQRPRSKMENLCDALREVGEMMVSRMKQYYDRKREIAITAEDGSGQVEFDEIDSEVLGGLYSIDIDVGASLPTSQTLLFQWAMSLREVGIIDDEAVLEVVDFPKRDRILKRMREKEEAEQQFQMEMAQAGGQAQPKPGPTPPGPFSLREQGPPQQGPPQQELPQQGGPPPPPSGMPPDEAVGYSQALEMAAKMGIPPAELAQTLRQAAETGQMPAELAPLMGMGGGE